MLYLYLCLSIEETLQMILSHRLIQFMLNGNVDRSEVNVLMIDRLCRIPAYLYTNEWKMTPASFFLLENDSLGTAISSVIDFVG